VDPNLTYRIIHFSDYETHSCWHPEGWGGGGWVIWREVAGVVREQHG